MVILVDRNDRPLGTAPKLEAHRKGLLHRAVSVVLFNGRGELLLQRRAPGKYHSGGLWANTCCSHPAVGEPCDAAAARRLREEMGLAATLRHAGTLLYRTDLQGGMQEHELDHVYVGRCDRMPVPDPAEVAGFRYASLPAIREQMHREPELYAPWFRIMVQRMGKEMEAFLR